MDAETRLPCFHNPLLYSAINSVARRANLLDPESVKAYLASAKISEARKAKLVEDLARFYGWKRIPFEKPNYRRIERLPFVPLEFEIDLQIPNSHCLVTVKGLR
jgi:hypothetical protein